MHGKVTVGAGPAKPAPGSLKGLRTLPRACGRQRHHVRPALPPSAHRAWPMHPHGASCLQPTGQRPEEADMTAMAARDKLTASVSAKGQVIPPKELRRLPAVPRADCGAVERRESTKHSGDTSVAAAARSGPRAETDPENRSSDPALHIVDNIAGGIRGQGGVIPNRVATGHGHGRPGVRAPGSSPGSCGNGNRRCADGSRKGRRSGSRTAAIQAGGWRPRSRPCGGARRP